ncbi:MAG TPA: hypothetical protein PKA64_07670 [Myxococcota bacterium]|nr:hypothetical protein [Myxococcota bacterium]
MSREVSAWLPPAADPAAVAPRVEVFVEPDQESRFWAEALPGLFAPPAGGDGWAGRVWAWVVVAPFAHVTFLNLEYQVYLCDVFHRTVGARLSHFVGVPLHVLFLLSALTAIQPPGWHPAGHGWHPLQLSASLIAVAVLWAWYVAMAARMRDAAFAVVMTGFLGGLWALGNVLHGWTFDLSDAGWVHEVVWWAHPMLGLAIAAAISAAGHRAEPAVPPRITGSRWWVAMADFLRPPAGGWRARLGHAAQVLVCGLLGVLDEAWAAPKMLAVGTLAFLYHHGHAPERASRQREWAQRAIASGQPAVDFIGVGGGAWLSEIGR